MKYVIASDIHGNARYASLLIEAFSAEGAEQLILLGDIYNPGPRNPVTSEYAPLEVANMLNALADKLTVVKGNCDSEVDLLISEFGFTDSCCIFDGGVKITLTHGHVYNKDNIPLSCGDALIYGHFHEGSISRVKTIDGKSVLIANAGSVSLPKGGSAHSYLVLEDGTLRLKELMSRKEIASEDIKI